METTSSRKVIGKLDDQSVFRRTLLRFIAIAIAFYALAFAGIVSAADAFVFLFVTAIAIPSFRPQLLLLAATVQDAPGLSYLWSYILFAGISTLIIGQYVIRRLVIGTQSTSRTHNKSLLYLWLLVIAVIVFSVAVSWAQANYGGYIQSSRRPYYAVGGLMFLMVTVGYVSAQEVINRRDGLKLLGAAALIAVSHTVLIGLIQIPAGPEFYRSSGNLERVLSSGQLTGEGVLGIARINGPFISPNAFGFSIMLCCLLAFITVLQDWKRLVVRTFFVFGALGVFLSLSKALFAFYLVFSIVVYWSLVSKIRFVLLSSLAVMGILFLFQSEYGELLLVAYRLESGLGARELAWLAVIENLSLMDWISGIGLSAWPDFFAQHVGFELSDPHTLFLSVPGTFGIAGIVLYASVLFLLLEKYFTKNVGKETRVAILGLLALLLGKDLVSIPALLGNTPFTYLEWLCLTLVLLRATAEPEAPRVSQRPAHTLDASEQNTVAQSRA